MCRVRVADRVLSLWCRRTNPPASRREWPRRSRAGTSWRQSNDNGMKKAKVRHRTTIRAFDKHALAAWVRFAGRQRLSMSASPALTALLLIADTCAVRRVRDHGAHFETVGWSFRRCYAGAARLARPGRRTGGGRRVHEQGSPVHSAVHPVRPRHHALVRPPANVLRPHQVSTSKIGLAQLTLGPTGCGDAA